MPSPGTPAGSGPPTFRSPSARQSARAPKKPPPAARANSRGSPGRSWKRSTGCSSPPSTPPDPMPVPPHEAVALSIAVKDALQAAYDGEPEQGYEILLAGLHRARVFEREGEEFAPELLRRWQEALDHFAAR